MELCDEDFEAYFERKGRNLTNEEIKAFAKDFLEGYNVLEKR